MGNICAHVHMYVCVCEGGGRVVLVRYLCVLLGSFCCLELCVFLSDCCTRLGLSREGVLKDLIIKIIIINKHKGMHHTGTKCNTSCTHIIYIKSMTVA